MVDVIYVELTTEIEIELELEAEAAAQVATKASEEAPPEPRFSDLWFADPADVELIVCFAFAAPERNPSV